MITTSHQRGETYTITINNIKDRAPTPNIISANSSYSYYFDIVDIIPPTISSVTIRDENHLDVTFSEEVEQASAEEKNNYRIDKSIEVRNALLDANLRVVHLTTTTHQRGETYTISINNVRDRAPSPNTIVANSSYSYFLPTLDTTPPTIAAVEILEETRVDITFSKQLERSSAENRSNYSINKGIEVLKAVLDNNLRIVHLTTSTHRRGEIYMIVINNVRDLAPSPNTIAPNSSYTYYFEVVDTTPPTISSVAILNETRVDVTFSEKVDLETAQVSSNYRINKGIKVKDAMLDANHKVVHLNTSEHQRGETYTVTVNNVRDQAPSPNTIAANSSYSYYFELIDVTAPTITSVNILDETTVRVVFSEPVESVSAETEANYKIDKGIQVLLAKQDTNASVVNLTTTSHQRGETYTITINNILDKGSPPNTIAPNSAFSYTYTPNFLIKNLSLSFYEVDSLKVGDEYYIDRHDTITYIPPDKQGLLWIKTANLDRDRTDDQFLSFEVMENIKVFVAYDSRAITPPAWLRNFFIKTNQYIGVSEYAQKFILWEQVFPTGKVTLGGNMAKGAFGAESMYLVLIQSGLGDKSLPGSWNIPQMFLLYQNFPNPFNAETEIRFDLAERSHVSLNVYNILGQLVKVLVEGEAMAARHAVHWDGTDEQGHSVPSGLYFVRLEVAVLENGKGTSQFSKLYQETRKMTIIK